MFKPLSWFIGLRYVSARRHSGFVSFISLVSVLGIALGITVLITVLSVMNGFDQQIQNQVFKMAPQVMVNSIGGKVADWQQLSEQLVKQKNIIAAAPYVEGQGLLSASGQVQAALIHGILPDVESKVSALQDSTVVGSFKQLKSGSFGIVIGQTIADNLGLVNGEKTTVVLPTYSVTPLGMLPRYKVFKVVGIFHASGGFSYVNNLAFINLHDAQRVFGYGNKVTGLRLKVDTLFDAPVIAQHLNNTLSSDYVVSDWTNTYGSFFKAIQMEKTMMFCILALIIAVAGFNLVSTLFMVVSDKRNDIAILRTMGASKSTIMGVFMVQGGIIGLLGIVLGVLGGVTLSLNATAIVAKIQEIFHVQLISASVYFVNYLPSKLVWSDVIKTIVVALVMSLLATLYPARKAAKMDPVKALRYE